MPPDVNVTHVRRWLFCSLRYSAWLANTCFWPVRQSLLSNPILSLQEHAAFLERLTLSSTLTLFSFPSTLGIMVSNDFYYCLVARLSLIDSFSRCRKSIFSRWRPNWCITSLYFKWSHLPLARSLFAYQKGVYWTIGQLFIRIPHIGKSVTYLLSHLSSDLK